MKLNQTLAFDRAWIGAYDPLAGNVEVLGIAGEQKTDPKDQKKDLKAGQRLALDASAAGWVVRHRNPGSTSDLASTQGRFLDHKHLYKDRFLSSLVLPFSCVAKSAAPSRSPQGGRSLSATDARLLEPIHLKLVNCSRLRPPAARHRQG